MGVASSRGPNLARPVPSIVHAARGPRREIAETPGIGDVAELIADQLADPQMRELIEDLRGLGLRLEEEGAPPGEGPLRDRPSC
jgi:hypothetical protein